MNLNEVLTMIAAQVKGDAQELIAYAAEDTLGGYHINPALATFKQGSCWGVEGQILYALVRWLKPQVVAEIGGWVGCSGAHLASAAIKNGIGHVYSVDNESGGQKHGADLPPEYRNVVTLVSANGQDWLDEQPDHSIGLLFEDADHSTELVEILSRLAVQKIEPGGVLVNHDGAKEFSWDGDHFPPDDTKAPRSYVGRKVRDGLEKAGVYFKPYLVEPSDCGVAITVMPGVRNLDKHSTKAKADASPVNDQWDIREYGNANIESLSTPPKVTDTPQTEKKTPARKSRTKAK